MKSVLTHNGKQFQPDEYVIVTELPECDWHKANGDTVQARYDSRSRGGAWGFMCEEHYHICGIGRLGTGQGQYLVTKEEANA